MTGPTRERVQRVAPGDLGTERLGQPDRLSAAKHSMLLPPTTLPPAGSLLGQQAAVMSFVDGPQRLRVGPSLGGQRRADSLHELDGRAGGPPETQDPHRVRGWVGETVRSPRAATNSDPGPASIGSASARTWIAPSST